MTDENPIRATGDAEAKVDDEALAQLSVALRRALAAMKAERHHINRAWWENEIAVADRALALFTGHAEGPDPPSPSSEGRKP